MGFTACGGCDWKPAVWHPIRWPEQRGASVHDGLQAVSTDHHLPDKQEDQKGGYECAVKPV